LVKDRDFDDWSVLVDIAVNVWVLLTTVISLVAMQLLTSQTF
jgi:hypothetical protein